MEEKLRDSWFAYASLLVADDQGSMDVDTLIITHDRLLLVELKEWNGKLESSDGKWYLNGKYRSKSPYEIKRVHALRIAKLLQTELEHKLGYFPLVEAHVVLCGSATPYNLSTSERRFVHSLEEFLEIRSSDGYEKITADQKKAIYTVFERNNNSRPNSERCLPIFKEFFAGPRIKAKNYIYYDYESSKDCWFQHRNGIYQEYQAYNVETPNLNALLRRWDLNRLGIGNATQEQWAQIALRESRVLNHVKAQSNHLEQLMLRPLVPLTAEDVSEECTELYELKRTYKRLDELIAREGATWSVEKRADLVRALLAPFSELHGLDLGHRDIDGHNLWFAAEQNSIVTSGYANAFFPEKGSIKDLRKLLQSSYMKLPEDELAMDGDILDPFKQDVFMLAVLGYQICFSGESLPKEDGVPIWKLPDSSKDPFAGKLNSWFESSLSWDPQSRFNNASEMLAKFNELTKGAVPLQSDKIDVYDKLIGSDFVKREFGIFDVFNEYPPIGGNPGYGEKLVYKSTQEGKEYLCKIWPQVRVSVDSVGINRRLIQLKKRVEIVRESGFRVPQIIDCGLLEGGGLFLVTEIIDGEVWDQKQLTMLEEDQRLKLAQSLIQTVDGMHTLNISHGDIHPNNIIVSFNSQTENKELEKVSLIDVVDFTEESEVHNTEYGPSNPALTDSFGRDRVACYKLVRELFDDDFSKELDEELTRGLSGKNGIPPSLEALERVLIDSSKPKNDGINNPAALSVLWGHASFPQESEILEQDEGRYFLNSRWDRKRENLLNCYITGISSQLTITLRLQDNIRAVERVSYRSKVPLSEVVSASGKAQEELNVPISVGYGNLDSANEKAIIDLLLSLDSTLTLLEEKFGSGITDEINDGEFESVQLNPNQVWKALIDSEEEILQTIEVFSSDVEENRNGNLLVPYSDLQGGALNFEEDDQIFVSIAGDDSHIGELVVQETNRDFLSIKPKRTYVRKSLKKGGIIQLESLRSKASRDRRNKALSRVIESESVISRLSDYFDVNAKIERRKYAEPPSEEDIRELYDSDTVEMNPKQVDAFQQLYAYGPVGVLQGPPGTGKTAFTSRFIHYLLEHANVQNILLVGQSHTAVDNVAIKAREVCSSHGFDLNIVRIGQEQMIDEELLHAHTASLQRQIRNKFHREYEQRISMLARHLLLPDELVTDLCFLHRTLAPLIKNREHLLLIKEEKVRKGNSDVVDITEDNNKLHAVEERISVILDKKFQGEFNIHFDQDSNPWKDISFKAAELHGLNNPSALQRLNKLLSLSQDWMDTLFTGEANYDSFLVGTRQLVCGTLVGMGLKSIELESKIFDWVIVDEAGRAQASELMVALQCAKRVLLVGDHKQLPPLYDREQLRVAAKKLGVTVEAFSESDFYRAFRVNQGITLDTQYRMAKPISDLVSNCFYSEEVGELKTGRPEPANWYNTLPFPLDRAVSWIDSSGMKGKMGEEVIDTGKYINRTEAEAILKILENLTTARLSVLAKLKSEVSNEQQYPIGIITMYRAQKELIESELSKSEWAVSLRHLIKIDTVDSYQGQENKIVILSLVRDNLRSVQGFLRDAPRINVAISRAQERLIIIGARRMWAEGKSDSSLGKVLSYIGLMSQRDSDNYIIAPCEKILMDGERV
ncbi:AAA family ATPase [Salinimonas sp. HHU 13199]|uniref:AAA family ATPase n=2 Tax=Salinimonas profundi TaxID=2729140 RepID=A0ABR8LL19_9ALTE|nr:AAA family ATPase [Salinimonas profundi]